MRGKSVALLVLALGCGLVAALGITQVLSHHTDAPVAETVPVIKAAAEIPPYTIVTNEMVTTEEWPKDRVPPGAIVRTEDIVGRFSKGRIFAGEMIIDPKLLARGEHPNDVTIPKGYRVVTIAVEMVSTDGGLVLPNSRVDLQLHVRKGQDPSISETMTQTILQNVRVFAVNDVMNVDGDEKKEKTKSIQGRTVSLLVTPQQAGIVTAAADLGTIRLIMRNSEDIATDKVQPVTPKGLLGLNDAADKKKEMPAQEKDDGFKEMYEKLQADLKRAAEAKPLTPEPVRWSVRMVAAGEVHDVVLQTFDTSADPIWALKGMPPRERPQPQQPHSPGASGPGSTPLGGGGLPPEMLGQQANALQQPAGNLASGGAPANGAANNGSGKNNLYNPTSPNP
jgi:pilus assembly protein CpaB